MKMIKRLRGLVVLIAILVIAVGAWAATITVPDDYPTIQAAIDAAQAGDTVFIRAGRYTENLIIDKPLTLKGENRTKTIIQSTGSENDVVKAHLSSGEISITGLKICDGRIGISSQLAAGTKASVTDVIASDNTVGIYVIGKGDFLLAGSFVIDSDGAGLWLASNVVTVENNEILRGGVGLLLARTVDVTLTDNLIGLCQSAITTYTTGCGFEDGEEEFSGRVAGEGNKVYGESSDLCPEYPSFPRPYDFVDQLWKEGVANAVDAFNRGVDLYNDEDYEGAIIAYTAGFALLDGAPFPFLEIYFHQNIGVVYTNLGQYEDALQAYRSARAVYLKRGMDVDVAEVEENIGVVYNNLGRYEEALATYESARTVYVEQEMEVDIAKIDTNIGNVYSNLGQYEDALEAYRSALAVYLKRGMEVNVSKIDQNIGVVYNNLGRYEEALATYESARTVYVEQEMEVDIAKIDTNIGNVYSNLGQYEDALEAYRSALAVYVQRGMDVNVANVDTNIGNVYTNLGQYEDALEAYRSARVVYVKRRMDVDVAEVDHNIGGVYCDLGRYEDALEAYRSSRAVYVANQMVVDVAKIDQNIGNVYWNLGRYEEALEAYRSSHAVYVERGMDVNVAIVEENIGVVYWDLGRYGKALEAYRSSRVVYLERGMDVNVAKVDINIGGVYNDLGQYEDALEAYRSARVVYLERGMDVNVAKVDTNVGGVYWNLGRYEDALETYRLALDLLDMTAPVEGMTFSYPASRWMICSNMGIAHEVIREWDEAREAYEDSIAVIESIRGGLTSENLKLDWQEQTKDVYERLIDLLYRRGEGLSAFTYAERCRARTFLDALYQGSISPEQLISPEAGISSGAVDPLAIDQAVADAREALQPNEAVLEYMVTDSGVYLWVITKEKISDPVFIEYERKQLMNDVIRLRKSLESDSPDQITLTELLTSFYDKLLKEGLAELPDGVDTLILIPSGPLWYLPFSALIMTDQVGDPSEGLGIRSPYLVENYTLAYLPSLASLSSLTKEETPSANVELLLALADPELSPDQLREGEGSKCGEEELGRYEELVAACQDFADKLLGEVQEEQCVYAGREAQEVLAHRDASRQIVVYAAHGQFNPYVPLESKLLLAPSEEAETADSERRNPDGNYHAWEVLLTDYRGTELVVLAACETLLPHLSDMEGAMAVLANQACDEVELTPQQLEQIVVGDEVVGLARAFLSSGAGAVLGTLWLANPTAIGELLKSMADYHKNEGNTWVQALTKAQRELIKGNTFNNPWFWAPYQLIGRWR